MKIFLHTVIKNGVIGQPATWYELPWMPIRVKCMDAHQGGMHGYPSGWDGTKWPCPEPTHSALVACSKDDPSQLEEAVQKIRECGGRHPLSELLLWGVPFGEKSFFLEKKKCNGIRLAY